MLSGSAARLLLLVVACGSSAAAGPPLSSSKVVASRLWVRGPDDGRRVQVVHSLSAFCEENGLDAEAMRAVALGEADDHEGWQCGEVCDYDAPPTAAAKGQDAAEAEEVESEDDDDLADPEADEPSGPPPMQKLMLSMGLPMIATQLLKKVDKESPAFLPRLRLAYLASVLVHIAVQLLLRWRIEAAKDGSVVKKAADPLSMLFGGGAKAPQTVRAYDLEQLKNMRNSLQMGVVMTLVMHLKFRMTQPLVYQAISQLVELFYAPLTQVHLVGHKPTGALKRPFGSGKGDMAGLMKGLGLPTPPTPQQLAATRAAAAATPASATLVQADEAGDEAASAAEEAAEAATADAADAQ